MSLHSSKLSLGSHTHMYAQSISDVSNNSGTTFKQISKRLKQHTLMRYPEAPKLGRDYDKYLSHYESYVRVCSLVSKWNDDFILKRPRDEALQNVVDFIERKRDKNQKRQEKRLALKAEKARNEKEILETFGIPSAQESVSVPVYNSAATPPMNTSSRSSSVSTLTNGLPPQRIEQTKHQRKPSLVTGSDMSLSRYMSGAALSERDPRPKSNYIKKLEKIDRYNSKISIASSKKVDKLSLSHKAPQCIFCGKTNRGTHCPSNKFGCKYK
jgi:hypothetical protein